MFGERAGGEATGNGLAVTPASNTPALKKSLKKLLCQSRDCKPQCSLRSCSFNSLPAPCKVRRSPSLTPAHCTCFSLQPKPCPCDEPCPVRTLPLKYFPVPKLSPEVGCFIQHGQSKADRCQGLEHLRAPSKAQASPKVPL